MALSFNDNRIVAIPIYLKIVWYSKPQTMAQCIKWDYRFGENFYYLCTWGTNCVKGRINTFLSVIWLPPRLTLTQLFLFRPKVTGSLVTKLGRKKSQDVTVIRTGNLPIQGSILLCYCISTRVLRWSIIVLFPLIENTSLCNYGNNSTHFSDKIHSTMIMTFKHYLTSFTKSRKSESMKMSLHIH